MSLGATSSSGRGVQAKVEIVAEHGARDIALSLAGRAKGLDAGMIVVGTRGLGAIGSAILGSVSRSLLTWSDLPVVVVHPGQDQAESAE